MLKTPRDGARDKTCSIGEHREGKSVRNKAAAYSGPLRVVWGLKACFGALPEGGKATDVCQVEQI